MRPSGQSLDAFTHWLTNFVAWWLFPVLAGYSASLTFALFLEFIVLQLFWVIVLMPQTKGVPLEDIKSTLGIRPSSRAIPSEAAAG